MVTKLEFEEGTKEDKRDKEDEEKDASQATSPSLANLDVEQKRKKITSASPLPSQNSTEDRRTEAALSSIDTRNLQDDDATLGIKNRDNVDQEAVRKAIDRLTKITAQGKSSKENLQQQQRETLLQSQQQKQQQQNGLPSGNSSNKSFKVDAGDVALMVEELEISKNRATDLLKASEGNLKEALRSFLLSDVITHRQITNFS